MTLVGLKPSTHVLVLYCAYALGLIVPWETPAISLAKIEPPLTECKEDPIQALFTTTALDLLESDILIDWYYWLIVMNIFILNSQEALQKQQEQEATISRKTKDLNRKASGARVKTVKFTSMLWFNVLSSTLYQCIALGGMAEWLDHLTLVHRVPGLKQPSDLSHKVWAEN